MDPTFLQIFLLANVFLVGAVVALTIRHAYAHFRPREEHPTEQSRDTHLSLVVKRRLLEASRNKFQTVINHSVSKLDQELNTTIGQLNARIGQLGSEVINDEMKRYHATIDDMRRQAETAIIGAQSDIAKHQAELKTSLDERQAQLESELAQRRMEVEQKLSERQASIETKLKDHQNEVETRLAERQAKLDEHQNEVENRLAERQAEADTNIVKRQTEVETKLAQHQAEVETRLSSLQAEVESNLAERRAQAEAKLSEEINTEKQRLIGQVETRLADAVASFLSETLGHNVDLGAQSSYMTAMLEEHKAELLKEIADGY